MSKFLLILAAASLCLACATIGAAQVAPAAPGPAESATQQAPSAEKQALVKQLLEALNIQKMSRDVMELTFDQLDKEENSILDATLSQTKGFNELTPDEQKSLHESMARAGTNMRQRSRELFTKKIDLGRMTEEISGLLYAKYFNESELKDLVAFYQSPTGKRAMELTPSLMAEAVTQLQERVDPFLKELISDVSGAEVASLQSKLRRLQSRITKFRRAGKPRDANKSIELLAQ